MHHYPYPPRTTNHTPHHQWHQPYPVPPSHTPCHHVPLVGLVWPQCRGTTWVTPVPLRITRGTTQPRHHWCNPSREQGFGGTAVTLAFGPNPRLPMATRLPIGDRTCPCRHHLGLGLLRTTRTCPSRWGHLSPRGRGAVLRQGGGRHDAYLAATGDGCASRPVLPCQHPRARAMPLSNAASFVPARPWNHLSHVGPYSLYRGDPSSSEPPLIVLTLPRGLEAPRCDTCLPASQAQPTP